MGREVSEKHRNLIAALPIALAGHDGSAAMNHMPLSRDFQADGHFCPLGNRAFTGEFNAAFSELHLGGRKPQTFTYGGG